ncbi:unnamed protein product, partial [Porites lobata]
RRAADVLKNTTGAKITVDRETILKINKLLSELKPQLCHSNGDSCLPSPPGPPGPKGDKGSRGRRGHTGQSGNKGDQGIMGSPGKSGKQGIMGLVGPKGEAGLKGQKGDIGPAGMPGVKGVPGESIPAPVVAVSPKTLTVNEGRSASFQCSVSGNPKPAINWGKRNSQSQISRSMASEGKLLLTNVRGSDSDFYFCAASNLLGRVEKNTLLVVVSPPRFTIKPPAKVVAWVGETLILNCSATGDPQPVISWKKQGGQLPVGRSQQINGSLVIRSLTLNDKGNYICVA